MGAAKKENTKAKERLNKLKVAWASRLYLFENDLRYSVWHIPLGMQVVNLTTNISPEYVGDDPPRLWHQDDTVRLCTGKEWDELYWDDPQKHLVFLLLALMKIS